MARFDFPIIILAAGASSRMRGRDKLLETVEDAPLLRQQVRKARDATKGAVLVALPPAPHPRYAVVDDLECQTVAILDAEEGMNASLRQAFAALPPNAPCAMVLLGDLPALTAADLQTVGQAVDLTIGTLIWRGATQDGKGGHPIVFHRDLFPAIAGLRGDSGGREVVASAGDRVHYILLPDARPRLDLDTPEDWASWRKENHQ